MPTLTKAAKAATKAPHAEAAATIDAIQTVSVQSILNPPDLLEPPVLDDLEFPYPYNWKADFETLQVFKMMVSPALAWTWLHSGNMRNRQLSDQHVYKLTGILKRGHWLFNGAPICFD